MSAQTNHTEKLTDKAFTRMWIASIAGILLSLICLCSTTWAWYVAGTQSSKNVIQSGEGLLAVTVTRGQEEISGVEQGVALEAGLYTVQMTLPAGSASGYCVICVGTEKYRSPYILRSQEVDQTASFEILLTETTELWIEARWGIYSDNEPDVAENSTLTLPKLPNES